MHEVPLSSPHPLTMHEVPLPGPHSLTTHEVPSPSPHLYIVQVLYNSLH